MGVDSYTSFGNNLWPQLAVIAAGTGYTVSGIITVRTRGVSADTLSAVTFMVAAVIAVPTWIIIDQPWTIDWRRESFWALIYLGMVTTALAFLLRYYLIMRTGAVFLSYVAYLIPMVGIILGALMLGEMLKWTAFVAIFLILFGVYLGRN